MTQPQQREVIKRRIAGDLSDPDSVVKGFIFWANHFCFSHNEHKPPKQRVQPIVLWPIQEEIADKIIREVCLAVEDENHEFNGYGDKARMMAWTFLNLLIDQYLWQFHGISTVITSKTLDEVDTQGDMNTPFEKLRFQIELQFKQCPWLFDEKFDLTNKEHYKTGLISIKDGGAQIAGLKPSGKAMRGARALIWFGDEFPHTDTDEELWEAACGTVRIRIVGGTVNRQRGDACKAYKLRYGVEGEECHVFTLPWWEHPERADGLIQLPDGSYTSPWWEVQLKKKSKQVLAAEYLMDWNIAMGAQALYAFREDSVRKGLQPDILGGTLYCSLDPGGHWYGVCWAQRDRYGRLVLLRELLMSDDDAPEGKTLMAAIADRIHQINQMYYSNWQIVFVGDPYASRKQVSFQDKTEYELLYRHHKIRVQSAYMYALPSKDRRKKRIEILNDLMGSDVEEPTGTVTPKFLIDKQNAPKTYEAIKQKYRWKLDANDKKTDEIVKAQPANEAIDTVGMIAVKLFDSKRDDREPRESRQRKQRSNQGWQRSGRR